MPKMIQLEDDRGAIRESFSVGETVFVSGRDLPPLSTITFCMEGDDGHEEILARYVCDRHGELPTAVLIPYLGLFPAGGAGPLPHSAAAAIMQGKRFSIRATARGLRGMAEYFTRFVVVDNCETPRLHSSDAAGVLVTAVESNVPAIATLQDFAPGCVGIFIVKRQFDWRPGDAIEPVRLRSGAPAIVTHIVQSAAPHQVIVAAAGELEPGNYQFIARAYQPGQRSADDMMLQSTDIVSDRRFASLVVCREFNGGLRTPQIAGRLVAERPYFDHVNSFPKGSDVFAALDPDALSPNLVGRKAAVYVIEHKTPEEWAASSALTDVTGPGMSAAPKIIPLVPGCLNWNTTLIWPNPQKPGPYDIAIDFGNNSSDSAQFSSDATLNPTLDLIDGYVRVGFYVTGDASSSASSEDEFRLSAPHSPHVVPGGSMMWQGGAEICPASLSGDRKALPDFAALSFRITRKYESPRDPAMRAAPIA
ncbi:MAG TPA: hypothetical protein VHW24_16175 [Bryobacteraceae bacterium]|jgi:hypothetical protein|nr:hypothetical protein [Bryobacteraceae bacterium]